MKRILLLMMMLAALAVAAMAQDKLGTQPKAVPAQAETVKPFTPQQVEQLRALNNQFSIAQANARAAQAEAELAQERIKGALKDACHDAGYPLDECTVDPSGAGLKRIPKAKSDPPKDK